MANKVYYKLGDQAGVFYDPSLRILIRKGEVVAFDANPKSKKFNMAKAGGHISVASKDEYEAYVNQTDAVETVEVTTPEPEKKEEPEVILKGKLTPDELALKKTLEGMEDNSAIIEYFKNEGFLEEDIEKLNEKLDSKKATLIKLALELNREYK
jgi:hypothetical protein